MLDINTTPREILNHKKIQNLHNLRFHVRSLKLTFTYNVFFFFQNYSTKCCRTCDQLSILFPSPVTKLTFTGNFFFKITAQNAVEMWSVKHIISFPSYKINFHRKFFFQNYSTKYFRTCVQLSTLFPSLVTKLTFTDNLFFSYSTNCCRTCDQLSIWFPSPVTKLTSTDIFLNSTKCCRTCDQLSIWFPSRVTK
jgi:hypothetical protein